LATGTYDVTATATDSAGNIGTDATTGELIVDTSAPVVTVNNLTTTDGTPQLTGSVDDPTATVVITVNGKSYSATNQGDGTWTLADNTIAPGLATGTYDVTATATNSSGQQSSDNTSNELIILPSPSNQVPLPSPLNQAPVAQDGTAAIAPETTILVQALNATDADGSIVSYTITTLPPADQGVLFLGNPSMGGTVVGIGQVLTPAQADQLFFQSETGFTGSSFTYTATDDQGMSDATPATVTLSLSQFADCDCGCEVGSRLTGNQRKDKLQGTLAGDTLLGKKGNDVLRGMECNDLVQGGGGKDRLFGDDGRDTLRGGLGNDRLFGGKHDDLLKGGRGKDRLRGGQGNDRLMAGGRQDRLWGQMGNDLLKGGHGNDRLKGGQGDDDLRGGRGKDRLRGGDGQDRLRGGLRQDRLSGFKGNDSLWGGAGKDQLWGGRGQDRLRGGIHRDKLRGNQGHDVLIGGRGKDVLLGSSGDDLLMGGGGKDRLQGGAGKDQFLYTKVKQAGDRIIRFEADRDVINLSRIFAQPNYLAPQPFKQYLRFVQAGAHTIVQIDANGKAAGGFTTLATLQTIAVNQLSANNFVL
jgi:Ca2+-binding RTX toxin-like protein